MALQKFMFEYEEIPNRDGSSNKIITIETKNDSYFLYYNNGNSSCVIEVSGKIYEFCNRLLQMNINEWNHQCFDGPMDFYPIFRST